MALGIFEETFGTARNRYSKVSTKEATAEHLIAITNAVQAVVDTFRDPRTGDRYLVGLSGNTEAYTSPGTKRIVVSYKPIFDKGLKVSTACTVMTGLTLHEIGHTLYTFPNLPVVQEAFGVPGAWVTKPDRPAWDRSKGWDQLAYTMLNVGDDALLEARMAANLPVARDIFPTMLHWVAISTGMVGNRLRWYGKMDMTAKVNFACRAVRYPWTATWSNDARTREERLWWAAWGAEYIAIADGDGAEMVRLVTIAIERLRSTEEDDEPGDQPGETPDDEPEEDADDDEQDPDKDEDDDEGGDEPKGESPQPFGDDFDKPGESNDGDDPDEDEDSDEDDDDDDADGGDDDSDWDDDEADEDEDGDGSGKGDEDDDEVEDDDESGSGDDGEDADDDEQGEDESETESGESNDGESKDESDEDGDAKVGDIEDEDEDKERTFAQDFDAHDLDGNVDQMNHPTDWNSKNNGALLQREMDIELNTERIPTGKWGSARVEVRSLGQLG